MERDYANRPRTMAAMNAVSGFDFGLAKRYEDAFDLRMSR
jgi:hypothetical protein